MAHEMDFLLMVVVLLGLAALGATSLTWIIRIVAVQGMVLAALLIVAHIDQVNARLVALALLSLALKGFVFPWFIFRSMRESGVQREARPYVGFSLSLVLGAVALGVAFGLANLLHLPKLAESQFIVPASLSNVFFGLLLLVGRRTAVTQVLGYLILENGIFVFSLTLTTVLPTLVEMGVLLDLFVAVFIMGITIYQINREFDHIDASRLRQLQDLAGGRRRWPFGLRNRRIGSEGKIGR